METLHLAILLYKANRISAMIDFEFSGPDARVMDVAAGLKFSLRLEERSDPWTLGSHFYRGYKSRVELTQIEIDTITSAMLLSDVVSTIWWLGRDLSADRAPPDMQRMIDLRNFSQNRSTQIEIGGNLHDRSTRLKHGQEVVQLLAW